MAEFFASIDRRIIYTLRVVSVPMARVSLFVVFFWFGILKMLHTSPANPLVEELLERTLPFISFNEFIIFFSLFEMLIGFVFLVPRWERLAIALLVPHMITTSLPLIFLPAITWQGYLTPTLEGQYIIKNLVIIALVLGLAARLEPFGAGASNRMRS